MSSKNLYCQHCGEQTPIPDDTSEQTGICQNCGNETIICGNPSNSTQFLVWENGQQLGPFDQESIQQMLAEGRVKGDTLVCVDDGSVGWTPARELFLADTSPGSSNLVGLSDDAFQSNSFVHICLNSGVDLKIKAIWLYDADVLGTIRSVRNDAMEKLAGVSTGLSPIGSIGWVMASSIVIGAVEGALSNDSIATGKHLLVRAIRMEQDLRKSGVICPVDKIENIELPNPGIWRVYSPKVNTSFIHNGDDFLTVQTIDGDTESIRWNAVVRYVCRREN